MTIAIAIKVDNGVVLASDSAGSVVERGQEKNVIQIYNNSDKIFNIHKRIPVGITNYGLGAIGPASISTLSKDFRQRITENTEDEKWKIDLEDYSLEKLIKLFRDFIFEEYYQPEYSLFKDLPNIGFFVGGYSTGSMTAELWRFEIKDGNPIGPERLLEDPEEGGIAAEGQPEPIERLLSGFDEYVLESVLDHVGVSDDMSQKILELARNEFPTSLTHPAMPIQDALDLAHMLADLAINYSRFAPGPSTVGGPIELAAITKHEGFKWVKRKHYYSTKLNPVE